MTIEIRCPGPWVCFVNSIKPLWSKARRMPGDLLDSALRANVAIGVERRFGTSAHPGPGGEAGQVKVVARCTIYAPAVSSVTGVMGA